MVEEYVITRGAQDALVLVGHVTAPSSSVYL